MFSPRSLIRYGGRFWIDCWRRMSQRIGLFGAFPVSRPAISQHLRVLREVSLVSEERRGREHYYSLTPQGLDEVRAWMRKYERFWRERLQALGDYLDEEDDG